VGRALAAEMAGGNVRAMPFYYQKLDTIMWFLVITREAQQILKMARLARWKNKAVQDQELVSTTTFLEVQQVIGIELCLPKVVQAATASK
jgi:hypothetical protein